MKQTCKTAVMFQLKPTCTPITGNLAKRKPPKTTATSKGEYVTEPIQPIILKHDYLYFIDIKLAALKLHNMSNSTPKIRLSTNGN